MGNVSKGSYGVSHSRRKYKCDVCHKSFHDEGQMNRHMVTHAMFMLFECNMCDKLFSCSSDLQTHMGTHTSDGFQCPVKFVRGHFQTLKY